MPPCLLGLSIWIAGPSSWPWQVPTARERTFFEAHLKSSGLRFLNPDVFAQELDIDAYEASRIVAALRLQLVQQRESFIFETVFSDPVGDKLAFLKEAAQAGYAVVPLWGRSPDLPVEGVSDACCPSRQMSIHQQQQISLAIPHPPATLLP